MYIYVVKEKNGGREGKLVRRKRKIGGKRKENEKRIKKIKK